MDQDDKKLLKSIYNRLVQSENVTLANIHDRLAQLENVTLVNILNRLYKLEEKVDIIDKRTETYPQLYNNVDKLVKEIVENRQERTLISHHLMNHEKRISRLEKRKK